jgi:hypothetical protein
VADAQAAPSVVENTFFFFLAQEACSGGPQPYAKLFCNNNNLTSDRVGLPAELKHINKRRKRNQQGLPQ